MNLQPVIDVIEKLLTLHERMLELAKKKTDIVKSGDVKELQSLTKEELTYIKVIDQLEKERQALTNNATISQLVEQASETEATKLQHLKEQLTAVIFNIKEQNNLNNELLEQSLQFVQLSINAFNPEPTSVTYEKTATGKKPAAPTRSMFDSKA